jgi:hypothetical protein
MATLGHVAVAVVGSRWRAGRVAPTPLVFSMLGLAALALLPDIDFLAFHFGFPIAIRSGIAGQHTRLLSPFWWDCLPRRRFGCLADRC